MYIRKLIGLMMLATPLIVFMTLIISDVGVLNTLKFIGFSLVIIMWLCVGLYLWLYDGIKK